MCASYRYSSYLLLYYIFFISNHFFTRTMPTSSRLIYKILFTWTLWRIHWNHLEIRRSNEVCPWKICHSWKKYYIRINYTNIIVYTGLDKYTKNFVIRHRFAFIKCSFNFIVTSSQILYFLNIIRQSLFLLLFRY